MENKKCDIVGCTKSAKYHYYNVVLCYDHMREENSEYVIDCPHCKLRIMVN